LREKFQHVSTLADVERIAEEHLTRNGSFQTAGGGALESAIPWIFGRGLNSTK